MIKQIDLALAALGYLKSFLGRGDGLPRRAVRDAIGALEDVRLQASRAPSGDFVSIRVCRLCAKGSGGECHTPGCGLYMNRAPDIPPFSEDVEVDDLCLLYEACAKRHQKDDME